MSERDIKITFSEPKMQALEYFLDEKSTTVEQVLKEHLDKTYEKVVPQSVRKFVERDAVQEEENQPQGSSTQRRARGPGGRNRRQNEQNTRQEGEPVTSPGEVPAPQAEDSQTNQEENEGMSMSM